MIKKTKKIISAGLILSCAISVTACSNTETTVSKEVSNIELLEPVGATSSYETPIYRNMYSYNVVQATVCPSVSEYSFSSGQYIREFGAFPGQDVKKESVLVYGDTENIDKSIENQEKKLKDMESSYNESMKELKENLAEPKKNEERYRNLLEELEDTKPVEKIILEDGSEGINPSFDAWQKEYTAVENYYRDYLISMQKIEASISQKEELYNLDYAYEQKRLQYLKKDRLACVVSTKTEGVVVGMQDYDYGQYVNKDVPVMAVANMEEKEIRCEFIGKSSITAASEIYAYVNGKKYEIEYHAIDADMYKQLTQDGGKAYTTFTFKEEVPEINIGDYVAIVMINEKKTNVLSVSKNALHGSSDQKYVYVLDGNNSVYTPVKTGMKDGMYVEILSGITENDKILSEVSVVKGSQEQKVGYGEVHYNYKGTGYMYYPSGELVTNQVKYGQTYLVENMVSNYQSVEKGQVLCTVRVVEDSIGLQRNEKNLQRKIDRLNDLHAEYKDDKENKYYLKDVEQREEEIRELQKTIEEMKSDFKTKEIKATKSGVIIWANRMEKDDLIGNGTYLYVIADEKQTYIQVEDKGHVLNYGNEVSISYRSLEGERLKATGRVVTVNGMALSNELRSDQMLVTIDAEYLSDMAASTAYDGYWGRNSFEITTELRKMDNVLVVPRKAVVENAGNTFVRVKKESGEVVLTGFVAGGSDTENYWVAEGLTEGMTVCWE